MHPYGEGRCYYVGTEPLESLMDALMAEICGKAGIEPLLAPVAEVECMVRENNRERFLFVINHSAESKCYQPPENCRLLKGEQIGKLGAYEAQVLIL